MYYRLREAFHRFLEKTTDLFLKCDHPVSCTHWHFG